MQRRKLFRWACLAYTAPLIVAAVVAACWAARVQSFDTAELAGLLPSFLAPFIFVGVYLMARRKYPSERGIGITAKGIIATGILCWFWWIGSFLGMEVLTYGSMKLELFGNVLLDSTAIKELKLAPDKELGLYTFVPTASSLALSLIFGLAFLSSVIDPLLKANETPDDTEAPASDEPTVSTQPEPAPMSKTRSGTILIIVGALMYGAGNLLMFTITAPVYLLALADMQYLEVLIGIVGSLGSFLLLGGIVVGLFGLFRLLVGAVTKS